MKIPTITNRVISPGGIASNISMAGAQFQALSDVAGVIAKEEAEQQRIKNSVDETRVKSEMLLFNSAKSEELGQDPDSFNTWGEQYKESYDQALEGKIKELPPRLQDNLRQWGTIERTRGQILITNKGSAVGRGKSQVVLTDALDQYRNQAIRDPLTMGAVIVEANEAIERERVNGIIKDKQADKLTDAFSISVHDGIIDKNIHEVNPYEEFKRLEKRTYKNLDEPRRTYWMKQAAAEISRRQKAAEKAGKLAGGFSLIEDSLSRGIALPDNKDNRKAYDAWFKQKVLPGIVNAPPDIAFDQVSNIVATLGMAPESLQDGLTAALRGTNAQAVVNAARMIDEISDRNPRAYDKIEAKEFSRAALINDQVKAGASPPQALEYANQLDKVDERTIQSRQAVYRSEKYSDDNIDTLEDYDWVGGDVPENMTQQYERTVKFHYSRTNNIEMSRRLAEVQLKRTWGESNVGFGGMMNNPPEKVFSHFEEDTSWLPKQFSDRMNRLLPRLSKDTHERFEEILGRKMKSDDFNIRSDAAVGKKIGQIGYIITMPDGTDLVNERGQPVRWIPTYIITEQAEKRRAKLDEAEMDKKIAVQFGRVLRAEDEDEGEFVFPTEQERDLVKLHREQTRDWLEDRVLEAPTGLELLLEDEDMAAIL